MKVQLKINPNTILEAEGKTVKEVFTNLAQLEDAFSIGQCGLCGSAVNHVVRTVDKYTYYEARCLNKACRAKFTFGQSKNTEGALFPQKKDKDGNWKANGGWEIWRPQAQEQEEQEQGGGHDGFA